MKRGALKITYGCIGLLAGSLSDLSPLDFSPWELQCFHIKSRKLKRFISEHTAGDVLNDLWKNIETVTMLQSMCLMKN